MRASGPSGELRYGYQIAAQIGPWVITAASSGGFAFSAPTLASDEVWLAQRPLDLVLAIGQTEWIWRAVAPDLMDGRLVIPLTHRPDVVGPRLGAPALID